MGCPKGTFLLVLEPTMFGWLKILFAVGENEVILFPLGILTGEGERIPEEWFASNPPTNGATLSAFLLPFSAFAAVNHGLEAHGEI